MFTRKIKPEMVGHKLGEFVQTRKNFIPKQKKVVTIKQKNKWPKKLILLRCAQQTPFIKVTVIGTNPDFIILEIPKEITVKFDKKIFSLMSANYGLLQNFATMIRSYRYTAFFYSRPNCLYKDSGQFFCRVKLIAPTIAIIKSHESNKEDNLDHLGHMENQNQ